MRFKLTESLNAQITSSWDGDTYSYTLTNDGEVIGRYWSYDDAYKDAKKKGFLVPDRYKIQRRSEVYYGNPYKDKNIKPTEEWNDTATEFDNEEDAKAEVDRLHDYYHRLQKMPNERFRYSKVESVRHRNGKSLKEQSYVDNDGFTREVPFSEQIRRGVARFFGDDAIEEVIDTKDGCIVRFYDNLEWSDVNKIRYYVYDNCYPDKEYKNDEINDIHFSRADYDAYYGESKSSNNRKHRVNEMATLSSTKSQTRSSKRTANSNSQRADKNPNFTPVLYKSKSVKFVDGGVNLDYGCGTPSTFRNNKNYLNSLGCENIPYDPAYFPDESVLTDNTYDTVTCSNVLNVVPEEIRMEIIQNAYDVLVPGGTFYATVGYVKDYEEYTDETGKVRKRPTGVASEIGTDDYQANLPINVYKEEVQKVFSNVTTKSSDGLIIAVK